MKELSLYLDTNTIKNLKSNLLEFQFNETYKRLKLFLVENDINFIKVNVPKIVLEELLTQYIEEYRSVIDC